MVRNITGKRLSLFKRNILIILLLFFTCASVNYPQDIKTTEYNLKAVYLLNFLKFVEWPREAFENDHSPVVLAVIGEDPFGKILDETIQSEKIGSHPVIIKRFKDLKELEFCHVLFISSSEEDNLQNILKATEKYPVLTISDMDGFGDMGGNIGFFFEQNKIRFAINIQTLKHSDLRVSSKLLRLAKVIDHL